LSGPFVVGPADCHEPARKERKKTYASGESHRLPMYANATGSFWTNNRSVQHVPSNDFGWVKLWSCSSYFPLLMHALLNRAVFLSLTDGRRASPKLVMSLSRDGLLLSYGQEWQQDNPRSLLQLSVAIGFAAYYLVMIFSCFQCPILKNFQDIRQGILGSRSGLLEVLPDLTNIPLKFCYSEQTQLARRCMLSFFKERPLQRASRTGELFGEGKQGIGVD
jgi:hypothetical protein